ncbi:TPA: hypothetical protein ACH3X1_008826 [Trebouxia sp. C0004]
MSKAVKEFRSGSVEFQRSAERQTDSATEQAAAENETESGEQKQTALKGNDALFGTEDKKLIQDLLQLDQGHLFSSWPPPGQADDQKQKLVQQLGHLDGSYNGGLVAYIKNAKQLLQDSREGRNPFEGYIPEVPDGERMDFGSKLFIEHERQGVKAAGHAAFVLVAGGLGERLGYSGIKLALPVECASNKSFLQVYIESILALQNTAAAERGEPVKLEMVIMTSDDTHSRTQALLDDHSYFGMQRNQLHLLKQEKVACLTDNAAHLALGKDDPYVVQCKPHGHGDVHALLQSTGLVKKWQQNGIQWVCFFQDTNGLVFRALPAALGVSSRFGYDVNSLAVPRKAKEAIGGIARLRHQDGRCMTINVEYNQLDPLLRATGNGQGDVNNEEGWSPYPGNINQLILKVDSYVKSLEETQGIIAEFVNPKYKDASKTDFKSSTRLECMMQDYPKALPPSAAVGFTVVNQVWSTYSPVKNNPADALAKVQAGGPSHSATTGELDIYQVNCRALQMLGVHVGGPQQATFNGLHLDLYPRVTWSPSFAMTVDDLKGRFPCPDQVHIGQDAMLYINHPNVQVRSLDLTGALVVEGRQDVDITIDGFKVNNAGWQWHALQDTDSNEEHQKIRGFTVIKLETENISFSEPGSFTVPEIPKAGEPDQEQAESARGAPESKADLTSRSRQQAQDHVEGNHSLSSGAEHSSQNESNPRESNTSESDFVRSLVHDIMTKAAAEAKGASAATKEAEKLAADAAKSPKPKDEVALKKGTTGAAKGSEETPGHVVPAAENAEAGDKHARTEESKPAGSPKKGTKKAKTDTATDNGSAKALDSALNSAAGGTLKPSSPTKGGAPASKEVEPAAEVKAAAPSSPKKATPSSPKKKGIAEKVEDAVKKA